MAKSFYITTPIYYPSSKLHIGHAYSTVAADVMARYKRMCGYKVMFLTGTDEHGQKIETKAKEAGITPKQFVDSVVAAPGGVKDLWKLMNISNDRFIRTTDEYHVKSIQQIFKKMYAKGDIYKGSYKGKYCVPCESFWTESQLVDGKCPDCGREVKDAEEEAYFFRLSKYADRIRDLLLNTDFLEPRSRVNEMIKNFIDPGLEDLCVSRTSFSWGIPVDFDPKHVVYVWVDALFNYVTALGFLNDEYDDYSTFWPADVHFVGKEIVRFHSIIWPAMLMSMDMTLPKKVYGHGWLLLDGGKVSKSKANTTANVVDPMILSERYGVDALRYYLMREFPFGSDGNFSNELLINRINIDLANDLGNLLSRSVSMVEKYFDGQLPFEQLEDPIKDDELITMAKNLRDKYEALMDNYNFQGALVEIFKVIDRANKYIDENTPWILAKEKSQAPRLARVLYNLLETIRIASSLLKPFMPSTTTKISQQIGCNIIDWDHANCWGVLSAEDKVFKSEILFPRIDFEKEIGELQKIEFERQKKEESSKVPEFEIEPPLTGIMDFDSFAKMDLRVVKVLNCQPVKKSRKLLKFTLDDGTGINRQILSGIAEWYKSEELIGKNVVAVLNLSSRKIMGMESQGMLLSASSKKQGKEYIELLIVSESIQPGSRIC